MSADDGNFIHQVIESLQKARYDYKYPKETVYYVTRSEYEMFDPEVQRRLVPIDPLPEVIDLNIDWSDPGFNIYADLFLERDYIIYKPTIVNTIQPITIVRNPTNG